MIARQDEEVGRLNIVLIDDPEVARVFLSQDQLLYRPLFAIGFLREAKALAALVVKYWRG